MIFSVESFRLLQFDCEADVVVDKSSGVVITLVKDFINKQNKSKGLLVTKKLKLEET